MKPAGRLGAVVEILEDWVAGRGPLDELLRDWGRARRFAGSADRRAIKAAVYDAARGRAEYAWRMEAETGRALALAQARWGVGHDVDKIAELCAEPFGPGALSEDEGRILRLEKADPPAFVRAGVPEWTAAEFQRTFGADWPAEAAALLERAPLDLRVNHANADRAAVAQALKGEGVETRPTSYAPHGLRVGRTPPGFDLRGSPVFAQGAVEPQDEGSQIVAALSRAAPGEQVVDLCAGGGGKTAALAAMMGDKGQIYACDVDGPRLEAVKPRIARAGSTIVQPRRIREWSPMDGGADPDFADLVHKADLVLVDAPCTGSGVWRRKPDAKWRLRPERIEILTRLQDRILARAADLVRPGGRLVYITCSLFHAENEARAEGFLKARRDFSVLRADPGLLAAAPPWHETGHGVILSPRRTGTDGFYAAIFLKE